MSSSVTHVGSQADCAGMRPAWACCCLPLWLQIVGKLASEIAVLLQGKDKPIFSPKKNCGDVVVVINAAHVHFTHDTWNTKLYRWHTGA